MPDTYEPPTDLDLDDVTPAVDAAVPAPNTDSPAAPADPAESPDFYDLDKDEAPRPVPTEQPKVRAEQRPPELRVVPKPAGEAAPAAKEPTDAEQEAALSRAYGIEPELPAQGGGELAVLKAELAELRQMLTGNTPGLGREPQGAPPPATAPQGRLDTQGPQIMSGQQIADAAHEHAMREVGRLPGGRENQAAPEIYERERGRAQSHYTDQAIEARVEARLREHGTGLVEPIRNDLELEKAYRFANEVAWEGATAEEREAIARRLLDEAAALPKGQTLSRSQMPRIARALRTEQMQAERKNFDRMVNRHPVLSKHLRPAYLKAIAEMQAQVPQVNPAAATAAPASTTATAAPRRGATRIDAAADLYDQLAAQRQR